MDCYLKIVQKRVTLTNNVIPGPHLHCAEPLALWRFSQHLSAKYKRRPTKSLRLSAGPLALCHMVNPTLVFALRSSKRYMRA